MFLASGLTVISDGVRLVGLIECFKPEEINTPVEQATDGGLPVSLHVVVACLGSACISTASARPASFCSECQGLMFWAR